MTAVVHHLEGRAQAPRGAVVRQIVAPVVHPQHRAAPRQERIGHPIVEVLVVEVAPDAVVHDDHVNRERGLPCRRGLAQHPRRPDPIGGHCPH